MFLEMLVASTVSKRGNKWTQVYDTDDGWAKVNPMTSRGEAHESLFLLFARDGVLPAHIPDNPKEMI